MPSRCSFWPGPLTTARPIRARDILLAKVLTLGLTAALPFALTHWATVALRGFPLHEHAFELTWNAFLMVASCAVPVAALASVSRNLQSVVLMLLTGLVVAYEAYLRYSPDRPWDQEATALWIVIAGAALVLCSQVRFRRKTAGRIAIATVCLLSASTAWWPVTIVELEHSGTRKQYELPHTQSAHLPRVGWCRNVAASSLSVDCQYVGRPSGTLLVRWSPMKAFESERPVAPRWAIPFQHPGNSSNETTAMGAPSAVLP